jgi:hypothetical protein
MTPQWVVPVFVLLSDGQEGQRHARVRHGADGLHLRPLPPDERRELELAPGRVTPHQRLAWLRCGLCIHSRPLRRRAPYRAGLLSPRRQA